MGHEGESGHLSPLDAAFLELEETDESAHMHIGWAMVFEPLPGGGTPDLGTVRGQIGERLEALPRFRRRLSSPRVGSLSLPSWVEDPNFDVANLTRQSRLPEPGGEADLMEWLGDFFSHRLDRSHPLWETTLVDGLEGGRWALATKAHHCLVDGISGVSVATTMLDAEPEPEPEARTLAELAAAAETGDGGGGDGGGGPLSGVRRLVGGGLDVAMHPRRTLSLLAQSRAMAETLVRDELIAAPRTSLNGEIGSSRRFAAIDADLADLKRIKRELGGTVNDVVLAACAGGLKRLFEQRGEAAEVDRVRAMVPVNVRQASERLALGNRVSSLFVDLPVAEPDPLLRFRKTAAAVSDLKQRGASAGTDAVIDLAGWTPPLVQSVIARVAFTPRLFNITITNVPGPPATLYALGAPMRRVIPEVPIFSGHAVGVAVVSYDGTVTFGLNADRDTVPDLGVIRDGIAEALDELGALAG
ncbi:MAG: wax ester/triacylglycerol synthase family O-acyltransferase [Solirubrobacterales bacterium]